MLQPGELIAGKYRVEKQLGEGGMGFVLAAVHEQLQQRVAVKFLAESHAKNPDAAARFMREARAAVRIQSEHVARVIDVAELADGSPYMVMEFLHGNDLAEELAARGPFPSATAVDYILQACEALAEAHSIGLIHRDLKPANLFLTVRADGSPLVKVLDFGISKALTIGDSDEKAATLTSAQSILGSPAYMSPEQARTPKAVDVRTDIWALGVILYEFLTKTPPFSGDTMLSMLAATIVEQQKSVRVLRPELPPGIEGVVDRCLEKAPAGRYQTIAEFAEALGPFAEGYSRASIARVRGTVQRASSIPPAPMGATTLKSLEAEGASGVPRASRHSATEQLDNTQPAVIPRTDTLVVGKTPNPEPATAPKSRTVTAFGTSQSRTDRPRRFVLIVAAVALVLAAAAWRIFAPEPEVTRERSTASEAADPRSVAPSETQRSEPTAAAPSDPARPVIEPAPNDAESAVGSAPPMPEHAASASTHPKTHAPASTARPRERHPLDGRR